MKNSSFKFDLNTTIWYMKDNKVHSSIVLSRMIVENTKNYKKYEKSLFAPYGETREVYFTIHGEIAAEKAFSSKSDLLKSL
jgi:hypothetical protein